MIIEITIPGKAIVQEHAQAKDYPVDVDISAFPVDVQVTLRISEAFDTWFVSEVNAGGKRLWP